MPNKIQRITIKAIIHKDNSFLLVQDHKEKWEMPGGKVDFGESPEETLRRELKEELGFEDVSIKDLVDSWTFCVGSDGNEYQFVVIVYNVEVRDQDIKCSDEHRKFDWVPVDKIAYLNMREGYKESISKFLENSQDKPQLITKTGEGNKRCVTQPFVIVGSVIVKDGKYLFIHQNGKWNLPSGWLEMEENIVSGAKRETEEETGLEVTIKKLAGIFPLIKYKNDLVLHAVKIIFTSELTGKSMEGSEDLQCDWFTLEKIQSMEGLFWDPDVPKIIEKIEKGEIYPLDVISEKFIVR